VELFIRVASLGAIGKAGAEFGISPTAASQRIRTLENDLGTQLLNRTTRAVSLSADGEVFLARAKQIIADVEDTIAEVQHDASAIKGELRVAASASFGRTHIAPYVVDFLNAHPAATIQLHLSDTPVDIIDQGFDLAIRIGELAPSTLKARRLAACPRIIVATSDYIACHGRQMHPADLKHHNCLAREDLRTWSLRAPDGSPREVRVSGNFATNYAEAVTEAARSGLGIARKCRWEVADYLADGTLVTLLDEYTVTPEWNVYAVRSPSRLPPARVRAFTDFLQQKMRAVPALT
jgi:DNA-binding transcriptional LysR family regulator